MKSRIKNAGLEAGFDRVCFGPASPPACGPRFREWLAGGFFAGMHYLGRDPEARCDPGKVQPGARSVVAAALSYLPGKDQPRPDGTIARYARIPDYHGIVRPMLEVMLREIEALGGTGRAFVDTGPLLERGLAAGAGLGWIGKNTCLFAPQLGSWCFLGIILTDLELEPDPVLAPACGECTRCLDACPTGALARAYTLDARLCLSYHTVENRAAVPESLRSSFGGTLFGCDRCQEACPHNHDATPAALPDFQQPIPVPSIESLLKSTDASFRRRFAGTCFRRPGRAGLVRNAALAAASLGRTEHLEALEALEQDSNPVIREHVSWAIRRLGRNV